MVNDPILDVSPLRRLVFGLQCLFDDLYTRIRRLVVWKAFLVRDNPTFDLIRLWHFVAVRLLQVVDRRS